MGIGPVSEQFDQGRTATFSGPFSRPFGDRIHREEVIAVNAKARHAVTDSAAGESGFLAPGNALEAGNSPLVIDHIQQHRRIINRRKGHSIMKISLGSCAFANPGRSYGILAFIG